MDTTMIDIPTELLVAAKLRPKDVKVELAMELFRQGRLNAAQARSMAGDSARLEEMFLKKDQSGHIDMDAFISWAAHDLKSPLNAILGFTKVVIKGIDGPINEVQTTDLTTSYTNSQRMLTLINNLIDMARLNNGDLKIELGQGDLLQNLLDATTRWKTQNPNKELLTEIDIHNPLFEFDPARLRQITSGLLTYAANHVAEKGKVILHAQDDDTEVKVVITSSGEKARDRFELDLAMLGFICHGLVGLHGGSLTIGEDTGTGMTISFSLPRK